MASIASPSPVPKTATSSSDSSTLASYVTEYRIENGRRYHAYKDGAYWGPNDESANEGQDLAHELYCLTLGGLHLAPLSSPTQILDVGTGTGIWAVDMADTYPDACVTGTDLSPIQPQMVPPNCVFEVDDAELDWTWEDNFFDYVHVREMFGSIADWDAFFGEAFRCTKPGGWVEVVEHSTWPVCEDGTMPPGHFFNIWGATVEEMGRKWGKGFGIWRESKARLQRAGFVDVAEKRFRWPMNNWPKDQKQRQLGQMNYIRMMENMEGYVLRLLTHAGQWEIERAQVFLAEMRMALKDRSVHAYVDVTVVYGRKPS